MEQAGLSLESPECASPNPDGIFYDREAKEWRCELWAENWPALKLFRDNATQMRAGPGGVVGLDYNVIFHELDRRDLSQDDYDDLMGCIRVIEEVALKHMNKPA